MKIGEYFTIVLALILAAPFMFIAHLGKGIYHGAKHFTNEQSEWWALVLEDLKK